MCVCSLWDCLVCVLNSTEDIYDDDFFKALDGVVNALDNVEARESYVPLSVIGCVQLFYVIQRNKCHQY